MSAALVEANATLLNRSHTWSQPILAKWHIICMLEIHYLLGCEDHDLLCDLAFGLPMMGWARPSPTRIQRASPPPLPLELHDVDLAQHNERIIQSLGSAKGAR